MRGSHSDTLDEVIFVPRFPMVPALDADGTLFLGWSTHLRSATSSG